MAISKELEVQRLVILGAVSTLGEEIRSEIFDLKERIIILCSNASEKEYAMTALSLPAIEQQKEMPE
ncbi:TPA: hypothetical protein OUA92_000872 [Enterobacter hormaechei]|nr:hypothetical protein [Enterobacter hormaechei]